MTHQFNVEIAEKYGILESIILCHLHFWIEKNKANETNFYDGRTWTFNSTKAFSKLFPYASEGQIRRVLKKLESEGLILTGNYNKSAYDRTTWYALTDFAESIFEKLSIHLPDSQNGNCNNETPIPDINTDKRTDINTNRLKSGSNEPPTPKSPKPVKHTYGDYSNVLLSDEDMEKLRAEFPDYQDRIQNLSEYMASTGKSYKSHLATIRAWARKDKQKPQYQQRQAYSAPPKSSKDQLYDMMSDYYANEGNKPHNDDEVPFPELLNENFGDKPKES